jgi:hypothetical protein
MDVEQFAEPIFPRPSLDLDVPEDFSSSGTSITSFLVFTSRSSSAGRTKNSEEITSLRTSTAPGHRQQGIPTGVSHSFSEDNASEYLSTTRANVTPNSELRTMTSDSRDSSYPPTPPTRTSWIPVSSRVSSSRNRVTSAKILTAADPSFAGKPSVTTPSSEAPTSTTSTTDTTICTFRGGEA